MRMPAAQARAISRGAKTQLRVPVDTRITARPLRPARRHGGRPFHPTTDDILTIYGGHYEPIKTEDGQDTGRMKWITTDLVHYKAIAVIRAPLGTLTAEEALCEGYPTVLEFEIDWVERHEPAWLDRQISYLVENDVSQDEADETRPSWAKVRYDQYWTPRETWHLTIQPFDDMPYLLPDLPEEPEGIPVERIRQRWSRQAATRHEEARHEEERVREARQLGRRLRSAKLRDPKAPEITVIEQQLAELEARYSQAA